MNFILKIPTDLSQISVQQPVNDESKINEALLEKITKTVQIDTAVIMYPFSKGSIERLKGVKVLPFIYYIDNSLRQLQVVVYDFEGYGADIIHPVTGDLLITLKYVESKKFPYPLHDTVNAVMVKVEPEERSLKVVFECQHAVIEYLHTHRLTESMPDCYYNAMKLLKTLPSKG